jgi:hypothetical protein
MRDTKAQMSLYYGKVIPASVKQEVNKLVDQMKTKLDGQCKKPEQSEAKTMKFPPKTALRSSLGGDCYTRKLLKINGGRDRTRTCDLLRVKQAL